MTGADVAQPDQARIVGINAQHFLKNSGNFVISIKASCIDSTAPPEAVFAREVRSQPLCPSPCSPPSIHHIRLLAHFAIRRSGAWQHTHSVAVAQPALSWDPLQCHLEAASCPCLKWQAANAVSSICLRRAHVVTALQ